VGFNSPVGFNSHACFVGFNSTVRSSSVYRGFNDAYIGFSSTDGRFRSTARGIIIREKIIWLDYKPGEIFTKFSRPDYNPEQLNGCC
jgi:hypothetical protein